jgi:nucleotide-binding universal stress UspA family protein
MSYKTLMEHVDLDGAIDGRARLAAELASRFDASLIGISAWAPRPAFTADGAVVESMPAEVDLQVMSGLLKAKGEEFRAIVGRTGRPVEWRSALELPNEFLLREVRAADLLIIGGIRHPVLRDPYRCIDPGAVLLKAGRPVLVVPAGVTSLAAKHIAVAWKDTREARRAIQDALPFLQKAETVAIVEFCERGEEPQAQRRLEDVLQYLVRHGVSAAYQRVRPIDVMATNSLLHFLQDDGIDLVVAGGYGHSRLGEWIFGGVTRDLLTNGPVCCLLSH